MEGHWQRMDIERFFCSKGLPLEEVIDETSISGSVVDDFKLIQAHAKHDTKAQEIKKCTNGCGVL